MDNITQEDTGPQTEGELTSPPSPKRPRTECTMTNNHSGKIRFDTPLRFIFPKTIGFPSSAASVLQKNAGLVCTAECGDIKDEKPHVHPQDTKVIVTPVTELTISSADDTHAGSSKASSTAAERRLLLLVKDEQPPVTETDKLSLCPIDDAGGASAEFHTSKDTSADTSSHPDCKRLGKSLEAKPPGGCNLPGGNNEDGRQVLNSVSQIQAFTFSSSDEEGKCQPDCTYENVPHDTGFCNKGGRSAGVEESNLKKDECGFSENTLFSKEKEEGNSPISSSDYANSKSIFLNPEKESSGNLTEGVKNEKILELQICEKENFAACEGGTKGHVNENAMSKHSIPSAAERSAISNDVVLAKNVATENVSLEDDDICGAKRELAAGKMIVKTRSETADHTTETPVSARITQEPAEGDNDAGPFGVIEPAIWSETVREVREKHCNSESTVGVELSPSVKVSKMETCLPLCSDMRPSHQVLASDQSTQLAHRSRTQQWMNEKTNLCQSNTEARACSATTNKTCNNTGIEGSYHWKSSPSSSPCRPTNPRPAGDGIQESHDIVGHQLKEQDESSCFPVSLDHLKTQEVEYLETEITRMISATEIEEREMTCFEVEIRTDEYGNCEDSEEKISNVIDWTESNKLTHIDEELGNILECLSDHPYSAAIPAKEQEEKEREEEASEETDVRCGVEILVVTSEDGHQQQSQQEGDMTEASPDECVSINKELAPVSQHEEGNKLCCFSDPEHGAETFMVENKEDLVALTFPLTSDLEFAVVPGPHELIRSENADNSPAVLNCSDRFSPAPSAFNVCACMPRGFDTFEKIQLALHDDDDAGLSYSPLLTRLPGQLLKSPQRQLYHSMPEATSNEHREVPEEEEAEEEEEEEEEEESHTENMANGIVSSDYSCNELPNFISAADVVAPEWPEQQPDFVLACNSSARFHNDLNPQSVSSIVSSKSDGPVSEVSDGPQFEMKKQFDMVLKELSLFFEISVSDLAGGQRASSPEQSRDVTEASEADTCKEHLSVPEVGCHRDASDDAGEDHSLEMCGGHPVVSCFSGSGDSEQEVPPGSHLCQETSMYTSEKHTEPREMEQKGKAWFPSFMCRPFLEELSHRPPEQPRRLEPLRTCTRPLRVGLSKRAKTKHLHRPHPYR